IMAIVIVCVGAGVVYLVNQMSPDSSVVDLTNFSSAGILVIVVGVLVVLFVFCGCCGACLGTGWMLIWFSIILGCLLITECIVVGVGWKYSDRQEFEKLMHQVYTGLLNSAQEMHKMGNEADIVAQTALNFLQEKFGCCGDTGPNDYRDRNMDYKLYCYNLNGGYFTDGCTRVTADFVEKHGATIGGVVLGTMSVQLAAICLAIFLYFAIA
ncbi:23 kDa integral membrane protein-like, partial [Tropilaelaps mercedesae]